MISDFPAIVDACVLVQAAVRDTLLRLFERRLSLARWTDEIIDETVGTLRDKLGRTAEQTDPFGQRATSTLPGLTGRNNNHHLAIRLAAEPVLGLDFHPLTSSSLWRRERDQVGRAIQPVEELIFKAGANRKA